MKVLILGFGLMGRQYAQVASTLGHEVQVYDTAWPPGPDFPRTLSWAANEVAAFAWKPEAVVVATPAAIHSSQIAKAVAVGARVLVEKPLALSVEDYLRVRVTPKVEQVVVGYSLRHHVGLHHFRKHHLPRIGAPVAARIEVNCDMAAWPGDTYADALLECSHELDLARWLLGPVRVNGAASSVDGRVWELLLTHVNGCLTSVRIDSRYAGYRRGGSIVGEAGTARWNWHAPTGRWTSSAPGARFTLEVTPEECYRAETAAFLGGHPCGATLADALAVLEICDLTRVMVGATR